MLTLSVRSVGSRCRTKKLAAPFVCVLPWAVMMERAELVPRGVAFDVVSHETVEGPH